MERKTVALLLSPLLIVGMIAFFLVTVGDKRVEAQAQAATQEEERYQGQTALPPGYEQRRSIVVPGTQRIEDFAPQFADMFDQEGEGEPEIAAAAATSCHMEVDCDNLGNCGPAHCVGTCRGNKVCAFVGIPNPNGGVSFRCGCVEGPF